MKPDPNIGSEEEFEAFGPIEPPSGESLYEFREVEFTDEHRVWTITDDGGETECWYATPGFHIVNVMGYMVTELPWTDPAKGYYWFFDDRDRYEVLFSGGDTEIVFADDKDDARVRADIPPGESIVSIVLEVLS